MAGPEIHAGNLYVNRGTTGAIVRRQPFGGWKHSVVGPGAKAGGPNYVASLGTWPRAPPPGPASVEDDGALPAFEAECQKAWTDMSVPEDPSHLVVEANSFRYRPLRSVFLYCGDGAACPEVERALAAAAAIGVAVAVGREPAALRRVGEAGVDKVRLLGDVPLEVRRAAIDAGWWIDDTPVAADPRRELLRWVREQAVSERLDRHGDVTGRRPGLPRRLSGNGDI